MNPGKRMNFDERMSRRWMAPALLALAMVVTVFAYAPGLSGGWLFDDFPNIVNNAEVLPEEVTLASLAGAALSSPASRFKRPLASLSFAANHLMSGLEPFGWKLTNLVIHLLNGLMVFMLARGLVRAVVRLHPGVVAMPGRNGSVEWVALLVAAAWLLLPINLTAVLYVVQRMESLANLFVLIGLVGYVAARSRMLLRGHAGLAWCIVSLVVPTVLGLGAKESAVMLLLYAFLVEWLVFGFRSATAGARGKAGVGAGAPRDKRLIVLFVLVLWLPMLAGLAWLLPGLIRPEAWAAREFTLETRLLSEARIVIGYIGWTLLPTPQALSFYHDDFIVSTGLLRPWTTLASVLAIVALLCVAWWQRRRRPLLSLGIALYFAGHLLTGTILPLELVYEHRNYFPSFGLLLALFSLLAIPGQWQRSFRAVLVLLAVWWIALTGLTAHSWGDPMRLSADLSVRAPDSPRAQYDLGLMLMRQTGYDPASPFTPLVYPPLERAAALPGASILPEQALLMMNTRMGLAVKQEWWDSLIGKLRARPLTVQDDGALGGMTRCAINGACGFDADQMQTAFDAALSHPRPRASVFAAYGDYAWNVLEDRPQAMALLERAITADAGEPAYHATLARMAIIMGDTALAARELEALQKLNHGGRLDQEVSRLKGQLQSMRSKTETLPAGNN